jgi:hypothetical protein
MLVTAVSLVAAIGVAASPAHADPDSEAVCPPVESTWSLDAHDLYAGSAKGPFDVAAPFGRYWSVVAAQTRFYYDVDLALYDRPANLCSMLAASAGPNPAEVEWIAVDDVRRSDGKYVAAVSSNDPKGLYTYGFAAQFVEGNQTLDTWNSNPQKIGWNTPWMVDSRSVWLERGNTYVFTTSGYTSGVYLLSSTDDPATWTRTVGTAEQISGYDSGGVATGLVRVDDDGYYGVVFVRNNVYDGAAPVTVTVETIPDCSPSTGCSIPKP